MNSHETQQHLAAVKSFAWVTLAGMSVVLGYATYKDLESQGLIPKPHWPPQARVGVQFNR